MNAQANLELGMLDGLLGHGLAHLAQADAVLLLRKDSFVHNLEQIRDEGWRHLVAIDCAPLDEGGFVLCYRVLAEQRTLTALELQVVLEARAQPTSIKALFANAAELEAALEKQLGFRFC